MEVILVTIPSFILRRLYVKGSLRNTDQGFEFQLRNTLGSGYGIKLHPLKIDGEETPIESCYYTTDGKDSPFSTVSREQPFVLAVQKSITMAARDIHLSQESHKIGVAFDVPGLGALKFDFTDTPSNE